MPFFKKKYVKEFLNDDFGFFYSYKKSLFRTRSTYQRIQAVETDEFGRALLLDGIMQVGEKNEYLYHEVMTHPAMLSHANPKDVLVIGGGDGGILKEVLKHPSVRTITHVDIDFKVREVAQKYLPAVSDGAFTNDKVKFVCEDGRTFIEKHPKCYDIIIMDMTDPFGQAIKLYTYEYFKMVKKCF